MFRMDVIDMYQVGISISQKSSSSLYYKNTEEQKRYVLTYALGKLFSLMSFHQKTYTVITPTKFIKTAGKINSTFKYTREQQDAHEFINFIINRIAEEGDDELDKMKKSGGTSLCGTWSSKLGSGVAHRAFQGIMTTELRCLECGNSSLHTETFFDISVDIPDGPTHSYTLVELLDRMHEKELLRGQDKPYCDKCMCAQEAERAVRYLKLPSTLIVHLKRFKFSERTGDFSKLHHEIVYPLSLNMSVNSREMCDFPQDRKEYQLQAVVAHIGPSPHEGHYVAVIRRFNKWFLYNDDRVSLKSERVHTNLFGSGGVFKNSACAYILIYSEAPSAQQNGQMSRADILLASSSYCDDSSLSSPSPPSSSQSPLPSKQD